MCTVRKAIPLPGNDIKCFNVLIIDDDRELCALIRQSVLQEHIEADSCYSGKTGLQQLKEKEYQLVILDVMMPGCDGFEILEQIRKESSLPVSMFTSKNDSASKVRGLRAGADDYLTKPFDIYGDHQPFAEKNRKKSRKSQIYTDDKRDWLSFQ